MNTLKTYYFQIACEGRNWDDIKPTTGNFSSVVSAEKWAKQLSKDNGGAIVRLTDNKQLLQGSYFTVLN